MSRTRPQVQVVRGDISEDDLKNATEAIAVGWDIETSGLDWRIDSIGTCQIATPDRIVIVIPSEVAPKRLLGLLADSSVLKVFHHAPFDLRFMVHRWKTTPQNVACTKIAVKILCPGLERGEYSLKPVLKRFLSVDISKEQQASNWLSEHLSAGQLNYAAIDVKHLVALHDVLVGLCATSGLERELVESWMYLPTRVALDIRGSGDVFSY